MNIFRLSNCPIKAAIYQCDSHGNKMILESCQLMSTVKRDFEGVEQVVYLKSLIDIETEDSIYTVVRLRRRRIKVLPTDTITYKMGVPVLVDWLAYLPTHQHHPSTRWLRESTANWRWLHRHYVALLSEFRYRGYGNRQHACKKLMLYLARPPQGMPDIPETPFKLAMPEIYYNDDPVIAYRDYYRFDKRFNIRFRYTRRPMPYWIEAE